MAYEEPKGQRTDAGEAGNEYAEQLKTEKQKVSFVRREWERYDPYLTPLRRKWFEQILWFAGEHYLEYNPSVGRFLPTTDALHVPRPITNYVRAKCEAGAQLWKSALPEPRARAGTTNDSDRQSAEAANPIRRQLWRENLMEQKLRTIGLFTAITGNGFAVNHLDYADKEIARLPEFDVEQAPVTDPATGIQVMDPGPDGQPVPRTEPRQKQRLDPETGDPVTREIPLADVNTMVPSPFEIVPDFSARHPWEYRRWLYGRAFSLDFIRAQYGEQKTAALKPEKGVGMQHHYAFKLLEVIARSQSSSYGGYGSFGAGTAVDSLFMENAAIVLTFFELPCPLYPEGRVYSVCQDVLLHEDDYTKLYGTKLNLFHWRWSELPGSLFGEGMPRDLIDPQRRLNALDAQTILLRKTMGNPKWLSPKGAGFRERMGTSRSGYVYTYKGVAPRGGKPEIIPAVGPPADWQIERQNILLDMDRISGIPVILTGENPQGVTAGVSLDLLQESAIKRFQPMIDEARETLIRMEKGRMKIAQIAPAWQLGRTVTVLGEDSEIQAKRFAAADFSGNWDIDLEPVPAQLFSLSQKRADVLWLVQSGVIDPTIPANREELRRLFNASEFQEFTSPDVKRARYENGVFLAGGELEVHPLDDHATHVEEHRKPFKRQDREKLDQAALQRLIAHMQIHVESMGPADAPRTPPKPGHEQEEREQKEAESEATEGEAASSGGSEDLTAPPEW